MATKLMLVEDDTNLSEIYQARLEAEGFEIISAKDGEEALALAVNERPDLIICDVMMPRISGFDMLDILRGTAGIQDTKVIMMTALSQAEDKARAEKLGANRYLVKSQVTLEDVVKTVHEVLGDKPQENNPAPVATTPSPAVTTDPKEEETAKDEPEPVPVVEASPEPATPEVSETATPISTVPTDLNNDQTTEAEETTVESQIQNFVDNKESDDKLDSSALDEHSEALGSSSDSGHSMNKVIQPTVVSSEANTDDSASVENKDDTSEATESNDVSEKPQEAPAATAEPVKNAEPELDPNQIAL
jgi:DNA-binding response OmpR family regulator